MCQGRPGSAFRIEGELTSRVAWLDHDDKQRKAMLEIVDLFREKDTVDGLGFGIVQTAFRTCSSQLSRACTSHSGTCSSLGGLSRNCLTLVDSLAAWVWATRRPGFSAKVALIPYRRSDRMGMRRSTRMTSSDCRFWTHAGRSGLSIHSRGGPRTRSRRRAPLRSGAHYASKQVTEKTGQRWS